MNSVPARQVNPARLKPRMTTESTTISGTPTSSALLDIHGIGSDFDLWQGKDMKRLPGWVLGGQHQILDRGRPDQLFERTENLGQGSIGFVEEVKFRNVTMGIVRKRVFLRKGRPGEVMKKIVDNEVNVLRSLRHIHIIRLINTYEDVSTKGIASFSILMSPVGDLGLERFLSEIEAHGLETRHTHCIWLRSWFSCLASALTYIHSQGIRHEDIKPSNIVHRGDRIFFTDFSSSTRFRLGETTSAESQARIRPCTQLQRHEPTLPMIDWSSCIARGRTCSH